MRSNRTDESVATIAALIITLIIGIFILLTVSKCEAWTDHEFQARLSGGNDWKITSLPEVIDRSEEYDMAGKLGYLSYVYLVREDNKWDAELMYLGPISMDDHMQNLAKQHLIVMMRAIDKVLPDEKIVVISFAVDYVEMSIFFDLDRWKNEKFHVETAKKLNIERKKWKKSTSTD